MISSVLIGLRLSSVMRTRATELERARVFLACYRTRMRCTGETVESIVRAYISEHGGELPCFAAGLAPLLPGESVQERMRVALERGAKARGLREQDVQCLRGFLAGLGSGDTESQEALCELYDTLVNERLAEARSRVEQYAGIYTALSVLGGLAVSILLL